MAADIPETTPLRASEQPWAPSRAVTGFLCFIMISCSVGLINFNKWLMRPEHFPHAVPLVLVHMVICTALAGILYLVKPSLFPALSDPDKKIDVDLNFILTGGFPIAVVFSLSLVLSNIAYSHLGLAFIQMIKESNLIWVYVFSIALALERFKLRSFTIVLAAIFAMSLTIKGEMMFQLGGFLIQLAAILCEAVRIVLQGVLLQGKKVDPLSYVLMVSPLCGTLVLAILLISMGIPDKPPDMEVPHFAEVLDWAPLLVADAILAFLLNVSIAVVIKYTSPMSYVMCQLIKDVFAVLISVVILNETVGTIQSIGFLLQLVCVGTWSVVKSNEAKFEAGFSAGFRAVLFGTETDAAKSKV